MLKYLAILMVFFIPSATFAASSSVKINNEVNTSNNNNSDQNEANVSTDIRIETNGEVATYQSDRAEDVEINVIDGKSEIKVEGATIENVSPTATISPTAKSEKKEKTIEERNMFEFIEALFKSIFSLLV